MILRSAVLEPSGAVRAGGRVRRLGGGRPTSGPLRGGEGAAVTAFSL